VLVGSNSKLVVEAVVPYLLHVIPVVNDAVFNGISQFKHSLLGLGFLSDIGAFIHADHDVLILGSTHDRGEGGTRGVIP